MSDKEKPTSGEPEQLEAKEQDTQPSAEVRADVKNVLTAEQEAEKRGITLEQWEDVLHLIENTDKVDREAYPDAPEDLSLAHFEFDGNGNIIVPGDLHLDDSAVTHLPKNLKIKEALYLSGSGQLSALPEGLEVGTYIELAHCNILDEEKELPYLFEMMSAGKLKAAILTDWDIGELPEGLKMDDQDANVIYADESILSDPYIVSKLEEAEMMRMDMEEDEEGDDDKTLN